MSFIIAVHTFEGIIMASDSRTTFNTIIDNCDGTRDNIIGSQISDTTYKTFLCNSRIGISTCGASTINKIPITGYIEKFINEKITDDNNVEDVTRLLIEYFSKISKGLNTHFLVAGYNKDSSQPIIDKVYIREEAVEPVPTEIPGAIWDGEVMAFSKLILPSYRLEEDGSYSPCFNYDINFYCFTLQDAINFANYAVDVTIKTMAFGNCVKTVGGPIDILAIKPDGAFWVARKELHA